MIITIVVAGIVAVSIGLAIVEYRRRVTPLVFRCVRCEREFHRMPHLPYAAACPHCGARDWAS